MTEDLLNNLDYKAVTVSSSEMNYSSANRLTDYNGTEILFFIIDLFNNKINK